MTVKSKQSTLVMTIDLGGSKTKIVAQELGSDTPKVLFMDSQLADVGYKSLDFVPDEGLASERAWVGYTNLSTEGEAEQIYYTVGALARNRFGGLSQLYELKYELALPKILAAVWLAMVEMSLPPRFSLCLTVLLPGGEMSDADILKSRLSSCLKDFDTPNGRIKIKLKVFKVSSEGTGMYLHRKKELGDKLYSISQTYVMLGFRNASAFITHSGVLEPGNSSDFGMHWMLDFLASRISGLNKDDPRTIQIIAESSTKPELLKKLSRKRNPADVEVDYQSISAAIELAKEEYIRAIMRWLKSLGSTDEIIFCGGTAEFLRPELESYYSNDSTEIVWHGGVVVPSEFESLLGSSRLADAWALHEVFFDNVTSSQATKNKKTVTKKVTQSNSTQQQSSTVTSDTEVKKKRDYKSVVPAITVNVKADAQTNYNKRSKRPADTLPVISSEGN